MILSVQILKPDAVSGLTFGQIECRFRVDNSRKSTGRNVALAASMGQTVEQRFGFGIKSYTGGHDMRSFNNM